MKSLALKSNLARNLSYLARIYPNDYNFFPETWLLPQDSYDFKTQFNKKNDKTFIIKPANSCQGKGIFLAKCLADVDLKPREKFVA